VDLTAHGFYILPADRCGYDWSLPLPEGAPNSARGTPFNYFTQVLGARAWRCDT